jgi:hypothetical protein
MAGTRHETLKVLTVIVLVLLVCLGVDHACDRGWRKFDAFCSTVRVGQAFNARDFEGRVRARGWLFLKSEKQGDYSAMAHGPVGSVYLCVVDVKDDVVTGVRSINHPW